MQTQLQWPYLPVYDKVEKIGKHIMIWREGRQMKTKLPIGIDGFEKIRTNDFYYADKTLFIKELLQNWGEVNLFTRPRRFGKSLNMSMLKCFFEIGGDKALFNGLNIIREKELCEKYMGKFPVISISLKSVDGLNFEAASAALRTVIGTEAGKFRFLKSSNKLSDEEKTVYAQLTEVGSSQGSIYTMSEELTISSLKILCQLLSRHYGQKVILLVDEYDVPLDKAFQSGYYNEMVTLIRNMLGNALKTNENLYFAVLTGCLRISKESIFTGLNNLKVHTISDARYDEFFGFTDEEEKMDPLCLKTLCGLGIATSIDALAVGVSLALMQASLSMITLTIAIVTFLFSAFGVCFGSRVGDKMDFKLDLIGGLILIGIGFKILVEHLFFA